MQVIGDDVKQQSPILLLFPGLKEVPSANANIASNSESTTNVIRTLLGQKADFSFLKNAKKLRSTMVRDERKLAGIKINNTKSAGTIFLLVLLF